jgi:hypothetical protein
MSNRLKDIYNFLKEKGYDVYMPAVKVGECKSAYIVIKNDGSSKHNSFSTNIDLYSIMCYVPKQNYSDLEEYVQGIKKVMKELEPMILKAGSETPSFYDDSVKAHMISVEYKNYKKI